jgi:hypothetical protein
VAGQGGSDQELIVVRLPEAVDPDTCRAKFSRKTKKLTVTMSVL